MQFTMKKIHMGFSKKIKILKQYDLKIIVINDGSAKTRTMPKKILIFTIL